MVYPKWFINLFLKLGATGTRHEEKFYPLFLPGVDVCGI